LKSSTQYPVARSQEKKTGLALDYLLDSGFWILAPCNESGGRGEVERTLPLTVHCSQFTPGQDDF
jgi:hypothetical protein